VVVSMRRRLRKFLPIVLIALMVQILAPIAACWAASIAASDPLSTATICHDSGSSNAGQSDPSGQPRSHDGCCSVCSVAHTGAPVDAAPVAFAAPYLDPGQVVWIDRTPDLFHSRTGAHAQARAPPSIS
jgi:hypothetical protein